MIAALILAGGESRRMGFPKLMLEYRGTSLLAHAIQKANTVSEEVWVVVGAYADKYGLEAERAGASVIINPDWAAGLASSLRVGVAALPQHTQAVLVVLPDQPFVSKEHLQELVETYQRDKVQLVFSSYQNTLGAPTLIDNSLFSSVQTLKGNSGAKVLIREGVKVARVALADSLDVDTPEEAEQLLQVAPKPPRDL